jgi:hypothetical protein
VEVESVDGIATGEMIGLAWRFPLAGSGEVVLVLETMVSVGIMVSVVTDLTPPAGGTTWCCFP